MELKCNQIILDCLSARMKLKAITLPQDLKSKDFYDNERSIKVNIYKGKKIEKTVLTEMTTAGKVNNNNSLIYPQHNYDYARVAPAACLEATPKGMQ